jgi:ATP phosphoribosyltransferase regulatory subunit
MKSFTQIPPGTQILIGRAARSRRALERTICSVFEGWSYEEIIPPIFDYYDVFAKGWGQEEQIYRFIDREGNILALRPEFTSLVAKTAATRLATSPKPIRLYYSGEVLRFEKPKGGRQREFAQIGIEHYGSVGKSADVEVLLVAVETFQRLGIESFQINLGSVDFFGGIVDRMELRKSRSTALKEVLEIKDQPGLKRYCEHCRSTNARKHLRAVPHLTGGGRDRRSAQPREKCAICRSARSPGRIYFIFERARPRAAPHDRSRRDSRFDYYTGILFRAYVRGLGFEVASGGRYDGLPAAFGEDTPAVGFSFSLDRLEQLVMPALDSTEALPPAVEVDSDFAKAIRLRQSGKAVKLCL